MSARLITLPDPDAEAAVAGSFRRYGQLTPVVVCLREETHKIVDGFKRLAVARTPGLKTLSARLMRPIGRRAGLPFVVAVRAICYSGLIACRVSMEGHPWTSLGTDSRAQ